jgi:O-acetyl-ADP-ribose deacetylase (regulator of RNase III)
MLKNKTGTKMISFKSGNIFESKMQTLINPINCVGVMGKGLALIFKNKYPEMFNDYITKCANKNVVLGKPYLYKVNDESFILNFPTKYHWTHNSDLHFINKGLEYLAANSNKLGILSLAVPSLGCGNGGLNWNDVRQLIILHLEKLNIPIEIYEPAD